MRSAQSWLAPRRPLDFAWKSGLLCLCFVAWHFCVTRFLRGKFETEFSEIFIQAATTGFPFVFLFMLANWQQASAMRALTRRAQFDPLSGLLNRQTFSNRFSERLPDAHCGILLLIDVDHFKAVNDEHGHAMGDRCIEAIGHRLNWHLRLDDIAGRIGGEEFAVFLPDVTREHARIVATRLGLPVAFSDRANTVHLTVTLSIGAAWVDGDSSFEDIMIAADNALYEAKAEGRAQVRFSDGSAPISLARGRGQDREEVRRKRRPWSRPGLRSKSRPG